VAVVLRAEKMFLGKAVAAAIRDAKVARNVS